MWLFGQSYLVVMFMDLDTIYKKGIERVWQEDSSSQVGFLSTVAELRGMDASIFKRIDAFFVPNDDYMIDFFGKEITEEQYGCYSGSVCYWNNCVLIPITNVVGKVCGFASFNPFNYVEAHETGDFSLYYYAYSSRSVFSKGKFLYAVKDSYRKALEEGYLLLVDGIFDAISLWDAGFNAAATMGSIMTNEILMQLRFVKRVILIADNDEAGYKVYEQLCKHLNNVELFKQSKTKDADELLKTENRDAFIKQLHGVIDSFAVPVVIASF